MGKDNKVKLSFNLLNLIFAVIGAIGTILTVLTIVESSKVVKALVEMAKKDPIMSGMKEVSIFDRINAAVFGMNGVKNANFTISLTGVIAILINVVLIALLILAIIYFVKLFISNSGKLNILGDLNTPILILSVVFSWIFINYINYGKFGQTCTIGIILIIIYLLLIAVSLYARKLNRPVIIKDIKALINSGKTQNVRNDNINYMHNDNMSHQPQQRPNNYQLNRENTYSRQVEDEYNISQNNNFDR